MGKREKLRRERAAGIFWNHNRGRGVQLWVLTCICGRYFKKYTTLGMVVHTCNHST
jgi:hypothetical protein